MFRLIRVNGDSMSPTLNNRDYILINKPRSVRVGFIYVIQHNRLGRIVKRVSEETPQGYRLEGDNPKSTSATILGCVSATQIIGRALFCISPKGIRKL